MKCHVILYDAEGRVGWDTGEHDAEIGGELELPRYEGEPFTFAEYSCEMQGFEWAAGLRYTGPGLPVVLSREMQLVLRIPQNGTT